MAWGGAHGIGVLDIGAQWRVEMAQEPGLEPPVPAPVPPEVEQVPEVEQELAQQAWERGWHRDYPCQRYRVLLRLRGSESAIRRLRVLGCGHVGVHALRAPGWARAWPISKSPDLDPETGRAGVAHRRWERRRKRRR